MTAVSGEVPRLAGFRFDAVTEQQAIDHVLSELRLGRGGRIVTPNVNILRRSRNDAARQALLSGADLVLADGAPVVWALRLAGTPIPGRVPGSSFGPSLAAAAGRAGAGAFLLGGPPGSAERAAAALARSVPGLRVGWRCPPRGFEHDPAELAGIDADLDAFGPAVCLCGFGFPRQDQLASQLLVRHPRTWFVGVGASIAFMAGDVARAPVWMQRSGLEWLHRLLLEPRRLGGRYAGDIPFALGLLAGAAEHRLRGRRRVAAAATDSP